MKRAIWLSLVAALAACTPKAEALPGFSATWRRLRAPLGPTASNTWAVAAAASASGAAMLARVTRTAGSGFVRAFTRSIC